MEQQTVEPFSVGKLTEWTKEPTVVDLKADFEIAKGLHDEHVLKVDGWNDLLQIKGTARIPKSKGRSSVQPKLIRRQAEWRYSALTEPFLSSDKLFKVDPRTGEDGPASTQNQLVLNHQWDTKINKVKFIDEYVRTAVDEGSVIVRTGWKRVTVKVKQSVPVYDHIEIDKEEDLKALQDAITAKTEDRRGFDENATPELKAAVDYYEETGQPNKAVQTGTEEVMVEKPLVNHPTYDIINPRNFWIDPTSNGDIEKSMFAIMSFETCQADLRKEPNRYKNLDRVMWENNTPLTATDHVSSNRDNSFGFKDNLRRKVVAYEYWGWCDINGDGVLVPIVATWIGDVLIRMEENPFPDKKLPFTIASYSPVKRELFGESDAELLEDNQKILGAVARGMIDLLGRSANAQQGFAKGMLDPLNKRRYENGQDYEFNPNMPPSAGIHEHKYPEMPRSAMEMMGLQNQEAEALTGVKSFSGGISGNAYGDVAANARSALDAASKREMGILRRLAKGITEIGTKTISMNAVFLSEEETVRISNTEFVKVKRDELAGEFDLKVDISTAEVDNAKSQDLSMMLQTIGPNAGIEIVLMILAEIADLKRMPKLAMMLRSYKAPVDPIEEEMKQLALAKAKKEIEVLDSEIKMNNAKAAESESKKDMADLDYLEQETGTKHERDMEKQRGQSRGNQALEVTKAITKGRKEGETAPNIDAAIGFNEVSEKLSQSSAPNMMEMV